MKKASFLITRLNYGRPRQACTPSSLTCLKAVSAAWMCKLALAYPGLVVSSKHRVSLYKASLITGDYSPMHGTLIGALLYNLGISVEKLAQQKELDLRHHFSCWLSKPITTQASPFSRILCFERYCKHYLHLPIWNYGCNIP